MICVDGRGHVGAGLVVVEINLYCQASNRHGHFGHGNKMPNVGYRCACQHHDGSDLATNMDP